MNVMPQPLYPWERTLVSIAEEGGHQGQSGRVQVRENLLPMEERDFQPVASTYTDYTIPAPVILCRSIR
jgi:hypothetical protein